jgi:hypothetical protein
MTDQPHPPHKPPPTPAQEFAGIVGHMLDDKLEPIRSALSHLTDRFTGLETEFRDLRERQNKIEGTQRIPLWLSIGAIMLGLVTFGMCLALLRH